MRKAQETHELKLSSSAEAQRMLRVQRRAVFVTSLAINWEESTSDAVKRAIPERKKMPDNFMGCVAPILAMKLANLLNLRYLEA